MPVYEYPRPVLPVAAVFGANASGKSNLLDALRWLQQAVVDSYRTWEAESPIPRRPFRLDVSMAGEPTVFVLDVLLDGVQYVYGVSLDDTAVQQEWLHAYPHQHKRVIFERDRQEVELGSTIAERRGRAELLESLLRDNSLLLSAAVQAKQQEVMPVYRWFRNGLRFAGDRSRVLRSPSWMADQVALTLQSDPSFVELMRAADLDITDLHVVETVEEPSAVRLERAARLEAEISEIEGSLFRDVAEDVASDRLRRLRSELRFLREPKVRRELIFVQGPERVAMGVEDQSSGTLAWVDLLLLADAVLKRGATLVTDEIDASLHPRLTARLIELFHNESTNPRGAQLIFTTHDATLLGNNLGDEVLRRDEIWFIEKRKSASFLYPLSDYRPRRGENRERRYLAGSYGGVPVVFPDSLVDRVLESADRTSEADPGGSAGDKGGHGDSA